ncbi:hypothetical protein SERLA73DRAFT_188041 [Serpula lacrymans var. lacrymans S7.3]|uniref:G domain-containing protein n=1 Tax=Serpula lacrymans var. lacrymans (strain S7.3) TaxID=936435 RepID=F8QBP6_SERL3|nr:hypothetical protein SERLA73DRAFT_188041 [Serpula lacrymans var. lacrymans S7.3]
MVAVMGATGTGKSSFIRLLTKDENIHIGHGQESQTDQINTSCYFDPSIGRSVVLVDTPGFDDSRDGVSDVDILEKIAKFLQDGGGRKLNGIIYMHRISDPRMGGSSRKNLRMFKQLCGDGTLKNVCIVTTNWSRVTESEGASREKELGTNGNFFKPLLDAGAQLVRHDKELQSAQPIMSKLISKTAVTTQLQAELGEGRVLRDTSAGSVLSEEMKELIERHQKAMRALKQEMEEAAREKDEALKAELEEERTRWRRQNRIARS